MRMFGQTPLNSELRVPAFTHVAEAPPQVGGFSPFLSLLTQRQGWGCQTFHRRAGYHRKEGRSVEGRPWLHCSNRRTGGESKVSSGVEGFWIGWKRLGAGLSSLSPQETSMTFTVHLPLAGSGPVAP